MSHYKILMIEPNQVYYYSFSSKTMDLSPHENTESLDYNYLIERGKEHLQNDNFENTEKFAKEALKNNPYRPEAMNLLGELAEKHGHLLEAIKLYRAALDLDPTYQPAWNNLDHATTLHKSSPRLRPLS